VSVIETTLKQLYEQAYYLLQHDGSAQLGLTTADIYFCQLFACVIPY
jgi:hypothetical protein